MTDFGIEKISADEFKQAQLEIVADRKPAKQLVTEPRTRVVWFALPTTDGVCAVPEHDEIQRTLSPKALAYRARIPTRQVCEIKGVMMCRDCFLAGVESENVENV